MVGIPLTRPDYHGMFRGRVVGAIEAALVEADVESEIVVSPATHMQGLAGVVEASNFLARKCVVEGFDFLWIIEADVEVPKHALARLLAYSSDISLGIYPNHREDLKLMCGFFEEQLLVQKPVVHNVGELEALRGKVFEGLVWAGVGCCLIHRRVFEMVRFVWSYEEYSRRWGA